MKNIVMLIAACFAISAQAEQPIKVYAAGSVRPALSEAAAAYSAAKIEVVFGASGELRDRIVAGERPEVFVSANMDHPFSLEKVGLSGPTRRFGRNRLCALVAPGIAVDSATLLERMLDPAIRLVTSKADPSGDYAWQLFEKAERVRPGAYATLSGKALKIIGSPDSPQPPRSVYGMVAARGEADVFLTYCTNAREAKNENGALQVVQLPQELSVSADYGMVLVEDAREEAWYFVEFLLSPSGQAILAKHGFSQAPKTIVAR